MPRINDVNTPNLAAFQQAANNASEATTKLKLGGSDGVKTTWGITWHSTDRKAMEAFVAALRNQYGETIGDILNGQLDYVTHPKALTKRVVQDTIAAADALKTQEKARNVAECAQFVGNGDVLPDGSPAGSSALRTLINAQFAATEGLGELPADQVAIMKHAVERQVASVVMQKAQSGAALDKDFVSRRVSFAMENLAKSISTAFDRALRHGKPYNGPEMKFLAFFDCDGDSQVDQAAQFLREVKAEQGESPLDLAALYKALCRRSGQPEKTEVDALMAKKLAPMLKQVTDQNRAIAKVLLSKPLAESPFAQDILKGAREALELFPKEAASFGDLADPANFSAALKQSEKLRSAFGGLRTAVEEGTEKMDGARLQEMMRRKCCEELTILHLENEFQPMLQKIQDAHANVPPLLNILVNNAIVTQMPEKFFDAIYGAKDAAAMAAALKEASGIARPYVSTFAENDMACKQAVADVQQALVKEGYTVEEAKQFNSSGLEASLDVIIKDKQDKMLAEGKYPTGEDFKSWTAEKVAKTIKLKIALAESVKKMPALPDAVREQLRMEVLTNPNLKFPDMMQHSYDIAMKIDVSAFKGAHRDRTGQALLDAVNFAALQAAKFKTEGELDYEPFERQAMGEDIMIMLMGLHPELLDEVAGLPQDLNSQSLFDILQAQRETTTHAMSDFKKLPEPARNQDPKAKQAVFLNYNTSIDATRFLGILFQRVQEKRMMEGDAQ